MTRRSFVRPVLFALSLALLLPASIVIGGDVTYLPGNDQATQKFNHAATEVFIDGTHLLEASSVGDQLLKTEKVPGRIDVIKQLVATFDTIAGDYERATELYPYIGDTKAAAAVKTVLAGSQPVSALNAITAAAHGRRAIFINENHGEPITRVLPYALLAKLRADGYTYLALETLTQKSSTKVVAGAQCIDTDDVDLCKRGYPLDLATTGIYSHEPIYGELIREAIHLGFHLVAYDTDDQSDLEREKVGGKRLAQIFVRDPHARLIVLAGFEHIVKEPGSLATVFSEQAGIEPLSVDQTSLLAIPLKAMGLPSNVQADMPDAVVFIKNGKPISTLSTQIDISVYRPPFSSQREEATWLDLGGKRFPHSVDHRACASYPCLISAQYEDEQANAVPADRLILKNNSKALLYLKPGNYLIKFESIINGHLQIAVEHIRAQSDSKGDF